MKITPVQNEALIILATYIFFFLFTHIFGSLCIYARRQICNTGLAPEAAPFKARLAGPENPLWSLLPRDRACPPGMRSGHGQTDDSEQTTSDRTGTGTRASPSRARSPPHGRSFRGRAGLSPAPGLAGAAGRTRRLLPGGGYRSTGSRPGPSARRRRSETRGLSPRRYRSNGRGGAGAAFAPAT